MLIRHIGHAEFLIETESGVRIVTDPYDAGCGYPLHRIAADVALVSHHHHDHDAVENLKGEPRIIDSAGEYTPEAKVRVTAVRGFHDDAGGSKRGETLLFLVEAEGLRIVHLGDLGCALNGEQLKILRNPDVLMIPVGGFYTIDALAARSVCSQLKARVVVPMHYRTEYNAGWPIAPVDGFLTLFPWEAERVDLLRVTKADLDCQPRLVILKPIV